MFLRLQTLLSAAKGRRRCFAGFRPWLLILFLFAIMPPASGQDEARPPIINPTKPSSIEAELWGRLALPRFVHLIAPRDLPHQEVTGFAQDHTGMMWVGTQGGLARWDGYRSRLFFHDGTDAGSLPSDVTTSLLVDEQQTLFVATVIGVVARYDPMTEKFVSLPPTESGTGFHPGFVGDGAGGLWIGNANGLSHLPAGANSWSKVDLQPRTKVSSLLRDDKGTLWVGTEHGLFKLDKEGGALVPATRPASGEASADARITSLYQTSNGEIWFGTAEGVVGAIDNEGMTRFAETPTTHNIIRALSEVRPGVLFVGTDGGGYSLLDRNTGRLLQHVRFDPLRPTALGSNTIYSMFLDRSGGIWIGHEHGADYIAANSGAFLTLMPAERDGAALSGSNVYSVAEAEDGKVWIGTSNGGIDQFSPAAGRVGVIALERQSERAEASPTRATCILLTPDRQGWIGTTKGLYEVAGDTVRRVAALGGDVIHGLSRQGEFLWVGSTTRGLAKLGLKDQSLSFFENNPRDPTSLSDNGVFDILPDPRHGIWVATLHGLNLFDGKKFRRFMHESADPESLPDDFASTLLFDRRQRLWVGMQGGGIAILEGDPLGAHHFRHLDRASGLPNGNVDKLLEDDEGRIWASTDSGIAVIDPDSLAIRAFGPADGVALLGHYMMSGAKLRNNTLLFGGIGGVSLVQPDRLSEDFYKPPVVATAVRIGGRDRPAAAPLILPPDDHSLQVEFAALDYSEPAKNRYAYRLVGFDDDWITVDADHRLAAYTNLPPGHFRLLLRGTGRKGAWTDPPTELAVTVMPAWFQTLWFRALMAILTLSAIYGIVRARTAQMRASQSELESRVAARTYDLQVKQSELMQANASLNEQTKALETANTELALSAETLRQLGEVGQQITGHLEADAVFATLHRHLAGLLDVMILSIYKIDHAAGTLDPIYCRIGHAQGTRSSIAIESACSISALAARDRREYLREGLVSGIDAEGLPSGEVLLTTLSGPLLADNRLLGVMTVQSTRQQAYGERERLIFRTLCTYCSIALDNADAHTQMLLQEKMASLGTLTAGVAHEINNPLNFTHVSAQTLESDLGKFRAFLLDLAGDDPPGEIVERLDRRFNELASKIGTIIEGTNRIRDIVKDLSSFSRLDDAERKRTVVADILRSTLNLVRTNYAESVNFDLDLDESIEIECWPALLSQVFMNLMVNACQAIHAEQEKKPGLQGLLQVANRVDANAVIIEFTDNGCGINEKEKTRIFEPFYTTKEVGAGTGLGLSMSFGIIEKHGGSIDVTSKLGEGSCFRIRLPLNAAAA
jgi:signal transduction histidine kinase/ligand-binding sensor domain-containing protein